MFDVVQFYLYFTHLAVCLMSVLPVLAVCLISFSFTCTSLIISCVFDIVQFTCTSLIISCVFDVVQFYLYFTHN